ncbi:MAG: TlpA family protein disulfide reductase, partial [Deltaproteobacteria bacterium]|nr:TlpA family protein disulfide reductase [Deltaproteobacteria bacterium]
ADFERLSRIGSARGLQVVAVNVDREKPSAEDVAQMTSVLQTAEVSYPVAVDRELTLYDAWGTNAVPSAVLVDAAGKVLEVLDGYPPEGSEAFRHAVVATLGAVPAGSISAAGPSAAFALRQGASASRER